MAKLVKSRVVIDAISTVLEDSSLRAMVLSGPWGTGKTFLVREFARNRAEEFKAPGLKFVYISLFGIQSIADMRSRLAAAAMAGAGDGKFGTTLHKLMKNLPFSGELYGVNISGIGTIARDMLEGAVLKNLFVCIDDLERAGAGVDPVDVLGFISELIEQRGCKCLLVLNKDRLKKDTIGVFEEKVFDLTLDFRPGPAEVIEFGILTPKDREYALPVFMAFGSANIRVMKRLDWMLRRLRASNYPKLERIWPAVVRHAAIFTILKFERGFSRPMLEKVVERTLAKRLARSLYRGEDAEAPIDIEDTIAGPLDELGYTDKGFDGQIVDLLEQGSYDSEILSSGLSGALADQENAELGARMREIFEEMRGGFGEKAVDFAVRIKALLQEDLKNAQRYDIVAICDLLLLIENSAESLSIVTGVMTPMVAPIPSHKRDLAFKEFKSLHRHGILSRIPYEVSKQTVSLPRVFASIAADPSSWDPQFSALNGFTEPELMDFLLALETDDAMAQIKRARERVAAAGDELPEVERKTLIEKLNRVTEGIAAIDPLFRLKIETYGSPTVRRPGPPP